jgi:hypothetical protein
MLEQMMRGMGGPMIILMMVLLGLLFVYLYFYIAVWLYRDARKREMEAAVWLLIYIVVGLMGLFLYLILRKDTPVKVKVTTNVPITTNDSTIQVKLIPPISAEDRFCTQCGTKLTLDAKFCNNCGLKQ